MKHAGPNDFKAILREYIESLILAILIAVVLRSFVISAYKIPTESMLPNYLVGDFVVAYKLPFGVDIPFSSKKWETGRLPDRGDVIIFKHPKDTTVSYIKRVIGLPGDRIEIRAGRLFLNGTQVGLKEGEGNSDPTGSAKFTEQISQTSAYEILLSSVEGSFGPQVVPPGEVFVLGDNRGSSDDSRFWGTVPINNIEGRVVTIWMSMDWNEKLSGFPTIRWSRLFQRPH